MKSWVEALNDYSYPVKLSSYEQPNRFTNYVTKDIDGGRNSTIQFENHFRENAHHSIEVYFEVIFWKLYSQLNIRQTRTTEMIDNILRLGTTPQELYDSIKAFAISPNKSNLQTLRLFLSIKTDVLAVPLTFVAFFSPAKYPMVDRVVAGWINENLSEHNKSRQAKLTPFISFNKGYTSLRDVDFLNYINWVNWCNETAHILNEGTAIEWRPRDVEMAVFAAERDKRKSIRLSVLGNPV